MRRIVVNRCSVRRLCWDAIDSWCVRLLVRRVVGDKRQVRLLGNCINRLLWIVVSGVKLLMWNNADRWCVKLSWWVVVDRFSINGFCCCFRLVLIVVIGRFWVWLLLWRVMIVLVRNEVRFFLWSWLMWNGQRLRIISSRLRWD